MPNRISVHRGYNRTGIFETQSGTWLRVALVCLGPMLGLCAPAPGARLEASIVDDATGEPLAARVAVTNAEGKFLEIEGKHAHVQYLGKR